MSNNPRNGRATVQITIDGFPVSYSADVNAAEIVDLVHTLQQFADPPRAARPGGKPARSSNGSGPKCPHHDALLIPSKKRAGELYCPAMNDDGSYCRYTARTEAESHAAPW